MNSKVPIFIVLFLFFCKKGYFFETPDRWSEKLLENFLILSMLFLRFDACFVTDIANLDMNNVPTLSMLIQIL